MGGANFFFLPCRPVGFFEVQLKDTEKVVLVDSGFSSTTDSLNAWLVGRGFGAPRFSQWWKLEGI